MSAFSEQIQILNDNLKAQQEAGDQFFANFRGRPRFRVTSLDPMKTEMYGIFRHKGPRLVGKYAVQGFGTSIPDIPYAVIRAGESAYGVVVSETVLNEMAQIILGEEAPRFVAAEL